MNEALLIEGQQPGNTLNTFELSKLRLSQNFADTIGVKKALVLVPVRKPHRQDYVRVHPSPDYRLETAVLELKEERETYLVAPELWSALAGELTPKVLLTCMSRQKVLTLWPIRLPGEDGRSDEWNATALVAAGRAQTHWIRVVANMNLGAYDILEAPAGIPDPEWPDVTFQQIIDIAFKGRYIDGLDHAVLRRLRGEA